MPISPYAGKPAEPSLLINVPRLVTAYYTGDPDPSVPTQRVVFGTSGHRGSALDNAFNEAHILAITQAICLYRKRQGIDGPLFIGMDTHALSEPAFASALEVLAANGVEVMVDAMHPYTPTPVISHAILTHNRGRTRGLADGIVITPSHNPPQYGGFKYDPPQGGPADTHVTAWIEQQANAFLADGLRGVRRVSLERARQASTTHLHDYLEAYVGDLPAVMDLEAIRGEPRPRRRRSTGRRQRRLLGCYRRALRPESRGGEPRHRPHLPVYDRGLGRANPHGPLLPVRHGAPGRSERAFRRRLR